MARTNKEGLTFDEWRRIAGWQYATQPEHIKAWENGEDPTEYRAQLVPNYEIVRFFQNGRRRVIATRVTLAAAKAHCNDPETSSKTCRTPEAQARTRRVGSWYDGFRLITGS